MAKWKQYTTYEMHTPAFTCKVTRDAKGRYHWRCYGIRGGTIAGSELTLAAAKSAVERAVAQKVEGE